MASPGRTGILCTFFFLSFLLFFIYLFFLSSLFPFFFISSSSLSPCPSFSLYLPISIFFPPPALPSLFNSLFPSFLLTLFLSFFLLLTLSLRLSLSLLLFLLCSIIIFPSFSSLLSPLSLLLLYFFYCSNELETFTVIPRDCSFGKAENT